MATRQGKAPPTRAMNVFSSPGADRAEHAPTFATCLPSTPRHQSSESSDQQRPSAGPRPASYRCCTGCGSGRYDPSRGSDVRYPERFVSADMQKLSSEMRDFRKRMRAFKYQTNKVWKDLVNKLGTVVDLRPESSFGCGSPAISAHVPCISLLRERCSQRDGGLPGVVQRRNFPEVDRPSTRRQQP